MTNGQPTGSIRLNVADGTRQPIKENLQFLLRVLNGSKKQVAAKFVQGPVVPIVGLPYHDNLDDWYTIIVHADGYQDAGVYPVKLKVGTLLDAYVMLVPNDAAFHFPPIETIQADPALYQLLAN